MRSLLTLGLMTLLWGCAAPAPSEAPQPDDRPPVLDETALARATHARINRARQAEGLAPLAWDETLAPLARLHSADMASRGYFAHTGPDGRDVNARAQKLNLTCEREEGRLTYRGFGENLYMSHRYAGYETRTTPAGTTVRYDWLSPEALVERAVQGWLDSPGHRQNMLGVQYRTHALGVALSRDAQVYFTSVFC